MHRRKFLGLIALALAAAESVTPAAAKSQSRHLLPGEAKDLIKVLGDAAVAILSNKQLTKAEKTRQFRHLLNQSFALKGIARFALGRYWRRADFDQRRRYLKLFEDYIGNSYAARFGNYSGESFQVQKEKIDERGWAAVTTRIQRLGGEPVAVIWHLRERLGAVRIVDVVVEGISMSLTQRSDFAASIRTAGGDLDAFLDTLENKVRSIKSATN
ncbi:MAG: ABC transporter substrate-binding protein [Alphaproteobacteria bacterium]|nr:ABC transporter substrate-binding protein [Alphaproteobacteria bacterium]